MPQEAHPRSFPNSGVTWRLVQAPLTRRQCRSSPLTVMDYRYINVVHKKQGTMTCSGWRQGEGRKPGGHSSRARHMAHCPYTLYMGQCDASDSLCRAGLGGCLLLAFVHVVCAPYCHYMRPPTCGVCWKAIWLIYNSSKNWPRFIKQHTFQTNVDQQAMIY